MRGVVVNNEETLFWLSTQVDMQFRPMVRSRTAKSYPLHVNYMGNPISSESKHAVAASRSAWIQRRLGYRWSKDEWDENA